MIIKRAYPPNYNKIISHIPGVKLKKTLVFTYGDCIYTPEKKVVLSADLIAHEEVHKYQQQDAGGAEAWWDKYLSDRQFRLGQELQAYQRQILWLKVNSNRQVFRKKLKDILKVLTGPSYGNIISKEEAKKVLLGEPIDA